MCIDIIFGETFESYALLLIAELRYEHCRRWLFVHEIHKSLVTALLEQVVVGEASGHQCIDFFFESEKFCRKHQRVFQVFFIIDDQATLLLNIWLHLVKNHLILSIVATENVVKKVQLVKALFLKELNNTMIFIRNIDCHLSDQTPDADTDDLLLGLRLEPEVSVVLFSMHGSVDLKEILVAAEC